MKDLLKPSFWKVIFVILIAAGFYSIVIRFVNGLGAASAMNDNFPWGLWIGFDLLCGVGLAAGGFVICAAVYVFKIDKYKPIIRPTVLTAFLGYVLVIFALLIDLGRPWKIWHAIIMWNPKSVMFEVAWCVMLYTTVLFLEFSPVIFDKLKWTKLAKGIRYFTIPIVILGVILSTLHQSSLGSLFLIVPEKLHPFWYSPLLPFFFYISAIGAGFAMIIFESFLSSRAFKRELEMSLLVNIGRAIVVTMAVYLVLKIVDFNARQVWPLVFKPTYEAFFFWGEMLLGVIVPMVLLVIRKIRHNKIGLFICAFMVVLGFVVNRLNVSITGMESVAGQKYMPSLMEVSVTLFVVAIGFAVFALAIKYFDVFPKEHKTEEEAG